MTTTRANEQQSEYAQNEELTALVAKAKKGDSGSIERLVNDYKGLIRALANKFYLVGGDKEDLLQEGMLGLFYAINGYESQKGSFPSFAKRCVSGQIVDAVKRDAATKNKCWNCLPKATATMTSPKLPDVPTKRWTAHCSAHAGNLPPCLSATERKRVARQTANSLLRRGCTSRLHIIDCNELLHTYMKIRYKK